MPKHLVRYTVCISFCLLHFHSASLNCSVAGSTDFLISLPSFNFQSPAFLYSFHHFIFLSFSSVFPSLCVSLSLRELHKSLCVCVGSVAFYVRRTWKWLAKHLGLALCFFFFSLSLCLSYSLVWLCVLLGIRAVDLRGGWLQIHNGVTLQAHSVSHTHTHSHTLLSFSSTP